MVKGDLINYGFLHDAKFARMFYLDNQMNHILEQKKYICEFFFIVIHSSND
jgi:hypothetical protein